MSIRHASNIPAISILLLHRKSHPFFIDRIKILILLYVVICLQYDPKSRPVFNDIIKKLCFLLDKMDTEDKLNQKLCALEQQQQQQHQNRQCNQPAVSHIDCNCKMPTPTINLSNGNNNNNNNSIISKRNSIDAIGNSENGGITSNGKLHPPVSRENSLNSMLQHRRSLSENVIQFPAHTTPSDKARCHQIIRQMSGKTIEESSAEYSIVICPNITLRKVAETMFLKDPHYKPRLGDQTSPKSNPFTALAQLKGVKKILGANPSTYTAGVGDLFSSCFEMSSPFIKDLPIFQNYNKNGVSNEGVPKSLPSSPKATQKTYAKIDKSILKTAKNGESAFLKKDSGLASPPTTMTPCSSSGNSNMLPAMENVMKTAEPKHLGNGLELDVQKSTGTIKKYKANSLYSHPLFKCSNGGNGQSNTIDDHTDLFDNPRILTRRGSSESGFFSCLNDDDFAGTNKPSTFNLDRHSDFLSPMCRCCKYSLNCNHDDGLHVPGSNDTSSGILMMDDRSSTTLSSLRSLDDFDLFDKARQFEPGRHPNMLHQNDNDTLPIDMGLINRLSLDSEINSMLHQKNQFTNHLLYCKNRTSSIYTDSSDDISSLAGSDSLLWDDRLSSYTTSIPNARSAQIAKIVEYFERKGQSFKPAYNVPDSFRSTPTTSERRSDLSTISTADCFTPASSSSTSRYGQATSSASATISGGNDYCHPRANSSMLSSMADHRFIDFQTASACPSASNKDYETFCMELEKRPSQPRLTVCDGVVKSKLQIFDKLNNKRAA